MAKAGKVFTTKYFIEFFLNEGFGTVKLNDQRNRLLFVQFKAKSNQKPEQAIKEK